MGGQLAHLYATIVLLRELHDRLPRVDADRIAQQLWAEWDAGDRLGDEIWEWVLEYGIPLDRATGALLPGGGTNL